MKTEGLGLTDLSETLRQLAVARQDAALAKENRLRVHCDTADVRRAVLGAREFIQTDRGSVVRVDKQAFEKRETLPACLMAGGFLGQFTMLAPHQHEFLRQLQGDEAFSRTSNVKFVRDEFLRAVGITEPWGFDGRQVHDAPALRRILNKYAGARTELFYKAIQCTRYPWWQQLARLRATKMFVANADSFDYAKLLSSSLLPKIVDAFNKQRGPVQHHHLVSKNNFADAMCIMMLIELVERYNNGSSKIVPRFFDASALFRNVARMAGVASRLEVNIDRVKSSAFVGADYMMFRASLRANALRKDDALTKLGEDLTSHFKGASADLSRLQSAMDREGVAPLAPRLKQLLDYSFLENVWLRTIAQDELQAMAKDWAADLVSNAEFREVIEVTISEASTDVLKGADEYKRFSATWLGLRSEILSWRNRAREGRDAVAPLDSDEYGLDLFRVSPPENIAASTRRTLDTLADDSHDDTAVFGTSAWTDLMSTCVSAGRSRDAQRSKPAQEDFETAMAFLWCIGAYGRVVDLYRNAGPRRQSYFAKTGCAAAMLRLGREPRMTETLIEQIAGETPDRKANSVDDAQIPINAASASSLGYLWFHCWQLRWKLGAWWRCRPDDMPKLDHPHYDRLLRSAISAVSTSWQYIQRRPELFEESTAREIYVANQRLYYLVELGDESELEQMDAMYERLMGYKTGHGGYWRRTYSDTLARYFAYRAERTSSTEHWATYMRHAQRHFQDAEEAGKMEPAVQRFGEYLTKRAEKGFVGPVIRPR